MNEGLEKIVKQFTDKYFVMNVHGEAKYWKPEWIEDGATDQPKPWEVLKDFKEALKASREEALDEARECCVDACGMNEIVDGIESLRYPPSK